MKTTKKNKRELPPLKKPNILRYLFDYDYYHDYKLAECRHYMDRFAIDHGLPTLSEFKSDCDTKFIRFNKQYFAPEFDRKILTPFKDNEKTKQL